MATIFDPCCKVDELWTRLSEADHNAIEQYSSQLISILNNAYCSKSVTTECIISFMHKLIDDQGNGLSNKARIELVDQMVFSLAENIILLPECKQYVLRPYLKKLFTLCISTIRQLAELN